jgi:mannose-6-phosphate isomerase-like protein (cupin superfamily)
MNMGSIIKAWLQYLKTITDWQSLVKDTTPKQTGCGPVYELTNPIERPNESFAIADMRALKFAEPHYHKDPETEIYIVLQGSGLVVVGGKEQFVQRGSAIVTPPNIAHYTIPKQDLVLATINTPPFNPSNYVVVTEDNSSVGFNKERFEKLINE